MPHLHTSASQNRAAIASLGWLGLPPPELPGKSPSEVPGEAPAEVPAAEPPGSPAAPPPEYEPDRPSELPFDPLPMEESAILALDTRQ